MKETKYKYGVRCDEFSDGRMLYLPFCKKGWLEPWGWIDKKLNVWFEAPPETKDFMTLEEAHDIISRHTTKPEYKVVICKSRFIKIKDLS